MPPEVAKYLQDVRQACDLLTIFTAGKAFADYSAEPLLRAGVEREFIIVGEALMQAEKLDATLASNIPELRRIVGFRNILVHGYARVDHAIVWGIVEKDLPSLRKEIEGLLTSLGPP